ncbi:hypothetical protein M011DRAFT_446424 [Sporormia fimetaria CBS 119925]|uniref:Rhodopsin domain-containing protein n=1 Tax=Sporormia fimetaria CBS 119925 TaxID=1340428 RepID=A0A6A6V961_9PLEO|nr:hypothetical protein M011DRAFT_446424 [Sporormia fimetaria CBS 119925]
MASPAGDRVNVVVLSFTLLAGTTVFSRLYTRILVLRRWRCEDVFIACAIASSIGLAIAVGIQTQHNLGAQTPTLSPGDIIKSQKALWTSILFHNLTLTFTRLSLLLHYLRIFTSRRSHIICIIGICIILAHGVAALFSSVFLCMPVSFFWDNSIVGGKCLSWFAVWFSNASIDVLENCFLIFVPMPMLRSLEIPRAHKKALGAVFALGGIVCIISVVRLQSLLAISSSTDPSPQNASLAALSAVEANAGIIVACLPSLHPVLTFFWPKIFPPSYRLPRKHQADNKQRHAEEQHMKPPYTPRTWTHAPSPSSWYKTHTHTRNTSANTSTPSRTHAPLNKAHSRNTSNNTNTTFTSNRSLPHPTVARTGTGTLIHGPPRQVHIRSGSRRVSLGSVPSLPGLPTGMAFIGSLERMSGSTQRPSTARSAVDKKLPVTPFPVC